jgi:hypothetical protein
MLPKGADMTTATPVAPIPPAEPDTAAIIAEALTQKFGNRAAIVAATQAWTLGTETRSAWLAVLKLLSPDQDHPNV